MIVQGSEEWHAQRLGKVTASRIADMLAKTKSGWGASRANYAAELVCERLTGARTEGYTNAAMLFGTENEPLARAAYEFRYDCTVDLAGFVDHPRVEMSGASPDGLIGDDGLLEIKVPNTATHIATLLGGTIPEKYELQMGWQLACTQRKWCDFVSFDPRLPEELRLFVRRFEPAPGLIQMLEREVETFLAEVDDTIKRLRRSYAEAA
jgi:putative phage-type endonuclease